jgi:acetyltransferase
MSEYPGQFETDALLKDGRAIRLRPIRPDDVDREHEFFQRVGTDSAYFRFCITKPDLSPGELRHLTTVDYDRRMAFVAIYRDEMVAVGRYDVVPERCDDRQKVAEIALLVEDDFQGLGIGSHLMRHLTEYARLKGITNLEAFVLAKNRHALRLLHKFGYALTSCDDEEMYRLEFPLEP